MIDVMGRVIISQNVTLNRQLDAINGSLDSLQKDMEELVNQFDLFFCLSTFPTLGGCYKILFIRSCSNLSLSCSDLMPSL